MDADVVDGRRRQLQHKPQGRDELTAMWRNGCCNAVGVRCAAAAAVHGGWVLPAELVMVMVSASVDMQAGCVNESVEAKARSTAQHDGCNEKKFRKILSIQLSIFAILHA